MKEIIRTTHSVCPVCKKRLPAVYAKYGSDVYLEKTCPEHGDFSVIAWRGDPDFLTWCGPWPDRTADNPACPNACGLCPGHENRTCCAVLDVTQRCNLCCPCCFASSGEGEDMPYEEIRSALDNMYSEGIRYLHLSGGEPTVRDDLDRMAAYAAGLGYEYIQLNTNGIRLAEDPSYARLLCDAGVSSVFLQFDGTDDEIYRRIRGRNLFETKCRAIENCDRAELGVVLVPTVIPGVNDGNLGEIFSFAFRNMPAVKGMHIQPVTYTGRISETDRPRITMPEILRLLETQSGRKLRAEWFQPSCCDSPLCGFHAEFKRSYGFLVPQKTSGGCCCGDSAGVEGNQNYVRNKWTRIRKSECTPGSMDAFLLESNNNSFCISAMAFQDEENLDLGRLSRCSVHVWSEGRLIPFCSYHVMNYRDR